MSDTLAAVRAAPAAGASRPTSSAASGRLTRPDAASRVSAIEDSFGSAALAASGLEPAGEVSPVAPVPAVGGRTGGQPQQAPQAEQAVTPLPEDREPNGRGLLGTDITVLLAETRVQEVQVAARDPGQAELARAVGEYQAAQRRVRPTLPAA